MILRPLGPVIVLMPPLSLRMDELDLLVSATARRYAGHRGVILRSGSGDPGMSVLLVTGTDTGVGKTGSCGVLTRRAPPDCASRRGSLAETGCSDPDASGKLVGADAVAHTLRQERTRRWTRCARIRLPDHSRRRSRRDDAGVTIDVRDRRVVPATRA